MASAVNQLERAVVEAELSEGSGDTRWPLYIKMALETLTVQGWPIERWTIKEIQSARTLQASETQADEHWVAAPDLVLFDDERAAYRFNLSSENPRLFVVCDDPQDSGQRPAPLLVTLSQDEAASYLDGEDQLVFSTPLPHAIHCWAEAFIGRHGEPDLGLSRGKRRRFRDKGEKTHG